MGTCVCYGLNDGSIPNYFLDTNLNVCVNPCPSNPLMYYGDPITRTCVKVCSLTPPYIKSNTSYTGNYTSLYVAPSSITWNIYMADDDSNMCLSTCPASSTISIRYGAGPILVQTPIYYDLRNKRCVAECPST